MALRYLVTLLLLMCAATSGHAEETLPDGDGRDIVEYVCSQCHDLLQVTQASKTAEQWQYLVTQMQNQGAPIRDDEIEIIVRYLAEHFGN